MGLNFRKSINLGGLRLNLSNSGVGYSVGKKGVRISRSATGRTTSTVSIPGTGLSYTQNLGGGKKSTKATPKTTKTTKTDKNVSNYNATKSNMNYNANPYQNNPYQNINTVNNTGSNISYNTSMANNTYNSYITNYVNLSNEQFIKGIKSRKVLDIFSTILILFAALFFISKIFLIVGGVGLLIKIIMLFTRVKIDFDVTEQGKILYNNMNDILIKLSKNKMVWAINENKTMRETVKVSKKYPWYVSNIANMHYVKLKNEKIYFTPGYLVVEKGGLAKGYSYNNIGITNTYDECREEGTKPSDATIIGESYKFLTKDGMPDKRFSYNPKVPVCNYGCLFFDLPEKDYELVYSNMNSGIDSNLQAIDQVLSSNNTDNSNNSLFDSEFEQELLKKEESLKLERQLEEERLKNLK